MNAELRRLGFKLKYHRSKGDEGLERCREIEREIAAIREAENQAKIEEFIERNGNG